MREFPNSTPRPWAVHPRDSTLVMDAKGEKIASTYRFGGEGSAQTRRVMKDDAALTAHAVNTYEERERLLEQAENALSECFEYFDDRADVNWEGDGPNKEMSLLMEIKAILAKLEARDG